MLKKKFSIEIHSFFFLLCVCFIDLPLAFCYRVSTFYNIIFVSGKQICVEKYKFQNISKIEFKLTSSLKL